MSSSPTHDLAELAAQRLDGDLTDEAWRALEQTHGDALAQALAREAAMRDALRALPREPAPQRVKDAILAHAAAAPRAPVVATPRGRSANLWWWSAAALAAACLVTGVALQFEGAPRELDDHAAAGGTTVARVERRQAGARADEELAKTVRAPRAEEQLAGGNAASREGAQDALANSAPNNLDDAKEGEGGAVAFGAEEKTTNANEQELKRLQEDAKAWRKAHPGEPAAAPVPNDVLEQAGAADRVAMKDAKDEVKVADKADAPLDHQKELALRDLPDQSASRAIGGFQGAQAKQEEAVVAAKPAAPTTTSAPTAATTPSADEVVVAAVAPTRSAADAVKTKKAAVAPGAVPPAPASASAAPPAANDARAVAPVAATLAIDHAEAVMTLTNDGPATLPVRKGSLTLEGLAADGSVAWTLATGQPEADTGIPAGQRRVWRAPLGAGASIPGAEHVRLRVDALFSVPLPWPASAQAAPAAPAGPAAPSKP